MNRTGWFAHAIWLPRTPRLLFDLDRRGPQLLMQIGPLGIAIGRYL